MKNLYFLFIILLFTSCKDNERIIPECNVDDPINELSWLSDVKDQFENCTCQHSILEGEYNGKLVYYTIMNDPLCETVFGVEIVDCNGETIKSYDDFNEFANEVEPVRTLYSCK